MPEWNDRELLTALEAGDPRAGLLLHDRLTPEDGSVALRVPGARGKASVQTSDALVEVHGSQLSPATRRGSSSRFSRK